MTTGKTIVLTVRPFVGKVMSLLLNMLSTLHIILYMTARRNINNLRYADDTTLMAKSEEELKSLLMKLKEKSEKKWLKTKHPKN